MPTLYPHNRDNPPRGLIIGLAAKKQHGKDTAADWLVADEGFTKLSFADPMKRSAAAALGVTVEVLEDLKENPDAQICIGLAGVGEFSPHRCITVRQYLQFYGTQAHREIPEFGDPVWVNMMRAKVEQPRRYVVTDARFENEQRMIKSLGGYIVQINRPGMPEVDGHASEQIDHGLADYVIENDSDLPAYIAKVVAVIEDIRRVRYR